MPVSALVVTLSEQADERQSALAGMTEVSEIELGPMDGNRLATVLDAPDEATNRRLWQWLNDLPGVSHIDVVFVSLDETEAHPADVQVPICSEPLEKVSQPCP